MTRRRRTHWCSPEYLAKPGPDSLKHSSTFRPDVHVDICSSSATVTEVESRRSCLNDVQPSVSAAASACAAVPYSPFRACWPQPALLGLVLQQALTVLDPNLGRSLAWVGATAAASADSFRDADSNGSASMQQATTGSLSNSTGELFRDSLVSVPAPDASVCSTSGDSAGLVATVNSFPAVCVAGSISAQP